MSEPLILVPLNGSKQALGRCRWQRCSARLSERPSRFCTSASMSCHERNCEVDFGREAAVLDDFTLAVRVGTPAVEILQAAGEIKPRVIVMCKHSGAERGIGSHGDESAPRRSLSCGAGPAGARCNTMASSPYFGAARWDTLHQRRTATRGGACQTWSRRTAGAPRSGHQGRSGGAWLSHHPTLRRSATTRMARLEQRVCQASRKRLPARRLARAIIARPWQYRRGNPAPVRKTIHGPHRPRLERNMGSPSRGDPEGHSARGALSR